MLETADRDRPAQGFPAMPFYQMLQDHFQFYPVQRIVGLWICHNCRVLQAGAIAVVCCHWAKDRQMGARILSVPDFGQRGRNVDNPNRISRVSRVVCIFMPRPIATIASARIKVGLSLAPRWQARRWDQEHLAQHCRDDC